MNTLENKAKFFAQYLWQKVYNGNYRLTSDCLFYYGYLELKPLSSISDEDAEWYRIKRDYTLIEELGYKPIIEEITHEAKYGWIYADACDYLRSKGYALPWNGITVEQQIEYGWVKLK